MSELSRAPTRLEQTLAQLVGAGIAGSQQLAAVLGLDARHIARPVRTLTLRGALDADPSGALHLTTAGRTWLGITESPPVAVEAPGLANPALSGQRWRADSTGTEAALPAEQRVADGQLLADRTESKRRVRANHMGTGAALPAEHRVTEGEVFAHGSVSGPRLAGERTATDGGLAERPRGLRLVAPSGQRSEDQGGRPTAVLEEVDGQSDGGAEGGNRGSGQQASRFGRCGIRLAWSVARVRLALAEVRLGVAGVELSPAASRRIAAVVASSVVLVIGVRAGLPAWGLGAVSSEGPAQVVPDIQPPVVAAAPEVRPSATPPPVSAEPAERWVVVVHTNGLGLVLRPAPASPARVLTLQDGARVRVTGDAVQEAGRAWLPVASQTGRTGWVAADFVAPSP